MVVIADGVECNWKTVCVEHEKQRRRWLHFAEEMNSCYLSAGDFVVDGVLVLQVSRAVLFIDFH